MTQSPNSDTVTHGIRVTAQALYVPERSDPEAETYEFVYRITIVNEGDAPARLLERHWVILDSENRREDVRGAGVVGEQPYLQPGEKYEYMSRCPLATPWGTMEGSYTFARDDGSRFEVAVGRFFLISAKYAKEKARSK